MDENLFGRSHKCFNCLKGPSECNCGKEYEEKMRTERELKLIEAKSDLYYKRLAAILITFTVVFFFIVMGATFYVSILKSLAQIRLMDMISIESPDVAREIVAIFKQ